MSRYLIALAVPFAFATALVAAPAPAESGPVTIDLQAKANAKLKDDFHAGTFAGKGGGGEYSGVYSDRRAYTDVSRVSRSSSSRDVGT